MVVGFGHLLVVIDNKPTSNYAANEPITLQLRDSAGLRFRSNGTGLRQRILLLEQVRRLPIRGRGIHIRELINCCRNYSRLP
jgi:hypothetical protein